MLSASVLNAHATGSPKQRQEVQDNSMQPPQAKGYWGEFASFISDKSRKIIERLRDVASQMPLSDESSLEIPQEDFTEALNDIEGVEVISPFSQ